MKLESKYSLLGPVIKIHTMISEWGVTPPPPHGHTRASKPKMTFKIKNDVNDTNVGFIMQIEGGGGHIPK